MSQRYAVVDIETTGGHFKTDKITEIGIVLLEDSTIIKKYSTLINPERSIPPHITGITGITNEMVEDAPKFYEIAKDIVEHTEKAIFVAHNVRFDYQFLQMEFKSLGYTFSRRKLCTVKMSRKVFPGLPSYSLGKLIQHFNIQVNSRHRALDDAYAASVVLQKIFDIAKTKKEIQSLVRDSIKLTKVPKHLKEGLVEELPEECGLYYFKNVQNQIIYIGKSVNIQKRIKQHFSKEGRKSNRLFREVADIDYKLTGSELLSLVLESEEIKQHLPPINVAQKQTNYPYTIISYQLDEDYRRFEIFKKGGFVDKQHTQLGNYTTKASAKSKLKALVSIYSLCNFFCDLEKPNDTSCFNFEVEKCYGACLKIESNESYNERAQLALESLESRIPAQFIIIEEGFNIEESICFIIQDHILVGYSIIDTNQQMNYQDLEESIQVKLDFHPEYQTIVSNYMVSNPKLTIYYP